jgi:hypothetical protein
LKKIARRFARAGLLATITGVAAAALALPGTASAASTAVTITAAYQSASTASGTPDITVGNTFDLVYTIKNTSTAGAATDVAFTDQLPAGIVLDDNPGETPKGCAAGDVNTGVSPNTAGSSTISIAGVSVAAAASSTSATSCTISFAVVATTPLAASSTADVIASPTYTLGGTTTTTVTTADAYVSPGTTDTGINVFANPTLAFSIGGTPTYSYDQSVALSFTPTLGIGDSLDTLTGYDDQGNAFVPGSEVNTAVPGEHQITAYATTNAGGTAQSTFTYNVNSPGITAVKTTKTGQVEFDIKYLQAGSVAAEVLDGKTVFGKVTKDVSVGKNTEITVTPTAAGKKIVAAYNKPAKKPKHGKAKAKPGFKVKLSVLYTATNWSYAGNQPTITKSGITVK